MAEEIARLKRNFRHRGRGLGYRGKDWYEYVEKLTETALSKNSSKTGKGLRRDGYLDPKKLQDSVDQTGAPRNDKVTVGWCGPAKEAQAKRKQLREQGVDIGLEGKALLNYIEQKFTELCQEKLEKNCMKSKNLIKKSKLKFDDAHQAVFNQRRTAFKAAVLLEEIAVVSRAYSKSKFYVTPV